MIFARLWSCKTRRDDLAGAGAEAVDQDDHGEAREGAFLVGVPLSLGRVAALGADDASLGDEHVADLDRGRQQPAGIESQVDDQSGEFLLFERLERRSQFAGRVAAEGGDPDVADPPVRDRA